MGPTTTKLPTNARRERALLRGVLGCKKGRQSILGTYHAAKRKQRLGRAAGKVRKQHGMKAPNFARKFQTYKLEQPRDAISRSSSQSFGTGFLTDLASWSNRNSDVGSLSSMSTGSTMSCTVISEKKSLSTVGTTYMSHGDLDLELLIMQEIRETDELLEQTARVSVDLLSLVTDCMVPLSCELAGSVAGC